MNNDPLQPQNTKANQIPDYYNPHNTTQNPQDPKSSLLAYEPPEEDPKEVLKRKYPIKIIAGIIILVVTVLAIPVGVYLNQRPTKVFIEATTTPSPTPSPTPTETPTASPSGELNFTIKEN